MHDEPSCFICGKPGHIARNCRNTKHNGDKATVMLALIHAFLGNHKGKESDKLILDSWWKRHMSNRIENFFSFTEGSDIDRVRNHDVVNPVEHGKVMITAVV